MKQRAANFVRDEAPSSISPDSVGSSIPAVFEQIAAAYPQRRAIGTGSWLPTFAELNAAADSFAGGLRARGVPGGRVALLQNLDGFLIGSVLGILKAGQVVAVLGTTDPLPRLRQNLLDLDPWIVVADPANYELAVQAAPPGMPVAIFPDASRLPECAAVSNSANDPKDLAFLVQTSGSTGRSKPVMQTQRNILAGALRHNAVMHIRPEDRVILLASPNGSHAITNMFCTLLRGAAVCPFPVAAKGIIGLAEWIRRENITIYVSAASAFRHFLRTLPPDDRFPQVRIVRLASDAILAGDLRSGLTALSRGLSLLLFL